MSGIYPKFVNRLPTFTGYLLLEHGIHLVLCSILFWVYFYYGVEGKIGDLGDFISTGFFVFFFGAPILFFVALWISTFLVRQLFRSAIYMEFQETKFPRLVAGLVYFPFAMILTSRMYIFYFVWHYVPLSLYLGLVFTLGIYLISSTLIKKYN